MVVQGRTRPEHDVGLFEEKKPGGRSMTTSQGDCSTGPTTWRSTGCRLMDAGKSRYGTSGSAKHLSRGTDTERIEQLAERMLALNAQSPGNTPHE
jgi:hypothetical protein